MLTGAAEGSRDLGPRLIRGAERDDARGIGATGWTPQASTVAPRLGEPHAGALAQQLALELGDCGEHGQGQLRDGVAVRANVEALRDGAEPDAGGAEGADVAQNVEHAAAETIERPHHDHVDLAAARGVEDLGEAGAIVAGAGTGLGDVEGDRVAAGAGDAAQLDAGEFRVLVGGRGAVVEGDAQSGPILARPGSSRDPPGREDPCAIPLKSGARVFHPEGCGA